MLSLYTVQFFLEIQTIIVFLSPLFGPQHGFSLPEAFSVKQHGGARTARRALYPEKQPIFAK